MTRLDPNIEWSDNPDEHEKAGQFFRLREKIEQLGVLFDVYTDRDEWYDESTPLTERDIFIQVMAETLDEVRNIAEKFRHHF
jgi:hypothetical protein